MKTTPYTDLHIKLGAKMAEFAGYNMPIQYTTLIEEHNNVRNNVGVFDVSHMGEFRAKGPIAKHFMQYVTTNNVEDLFDGKVQYTCLPNGQGGVVDDMLVYRVHDDEYFMVPNAANIDKVDEETYQIIKKEPCRRESGSHCKTRGVQQPADNGPTVRSEISRYGSTFGCL